MKEFVAMLGIEFSKNDIQSLEQDNKVDVNYRDASFQIKELTDPDCRRTKMYKDAWKSLKDAQSLSEVSFSGDVRDVPTVAKVYGLILEEATRLAEDKYKDSKSEIDLLFYVTRTRASLIQEYEINQNDFLSLGWCSISCVNTKQAVVLYASESAPEFIKKNVARVLEK